MAFFHFTSAEFYALTPAQFLMLDSCRREALAHSEMVGAFTTAAIINHSMMRPEKAVSAAEFMPNHRGYKRRPSELSEEQRQTLNDFHVRAAVMAARMKAKNNA